MRSLQQRLEQLVAVHRQLLRKYAALELNLGESAKMIALRDERILALERESSDGFAAATAETQQLAKLVKELELKLLNKKPTIVEKVAAGPRTLRGGTGARDEGAAKKASSWWNR